MIIDGGCCAHTLHVDIHVVIAPEILLYSLRSMQLSEKYFVIAWHIHGIIVIAFTSLWTALRAYFTDQEKL